MIRISHYGQILPTADGEHIAAHEVLQLCFYLNVSFRIDHFLPQSNKLQYTQYGTQNIVIQWYFFYFTLYLKNRIAS